MWQMEGGSLKRTGRFGTVRKDLFDRNIQIYGLQWNI